MSSKMLVRYISTLFVIFSLSQSSGMEKQDLGVFGSKGSNVLQLQKDFECVDELLRVDLVEHVNNKEHLRLISSEDTTNLLRVNLYAYNESTQEWHFFSDQNIYASSWMRQEKNESNKLLTSTHDYNLKPGFTNIYLGYVYGHVTGNPKSKPGPASSMLYMIPEKTQDIIAEFNNRGCKMKNDVFDMQNYAHSEQAFLSYLRDYLSKPENNRAAPTFEQYKNMILVLSSTNDVCPGCLRSLKFMMNTGMEFRNDILKYFLLEGVIDRTIPSQDINPSYKHFNIFYPYLAQRVKTFEFDREFYTYSVVDTIWQEKQEQEEQKNEEEQTFKRSKK